MAMSRGVRIRWVLVLLALIVVPTVFAGEPEAASPPDPCEAWQPPLVEGRAVVWIRPNTAVGGDVVHLGDVACMAGDDALVADLEQVYLGSAPLVGSERSMSVATVRLRLRQAKIDADRVDVLADESTFVVKRDGATLSTQRLAESIEAAIIGALPEEAEVQVRVHEVGPIGIPPGEVTLRVQRLPSTWNGTATVSVEIWSDGTFVRTLSVKVDLAVRVPALVVTGRVERGQPITPDLVEVRSAPYQSFVQYHPADLERLVDSPIRATRVIQSGTYLENRFVEAVPDAVQGSRVTVEASTAGVQVLVPGGVLQDANVGESVPVRNLVSGARLVGRLVAPDRVVVTVPY